MSSSDDVVVTSDEQTTSQAESVTNETVMPVTDDTNQVVTSDGNTDDTRVGDEAVVGTVATTVCTAVSSDEPNAGDGDNGTDTDGGGGGDPAVDMMAMLYGNEEDYESDGDDNDDVIDTSYDDSVIDVKSEATDANSTTSQKRRSDETDSNPNKRIKAEPVEEERGTPTLETTEATNDCEPIDGEEVVIPKDPKEFMTYLLGLNGNHLASQDVTRIPMYSHLIDNSRNLQFKSLDRFRETFIPFIIIQFWQNAKREYAVRPKKGLNRKCSVIFKSRTNKMNDGLELKCISVMGTDEKPHFKFGQLTTIQTAIQSKHNNNQPIFSRRKYLAYVTNHVIRQIDVENQSEVNHLKLFCREEKRQYSVIEEITVLIRYGDDLYMRNDSLVMAEPLICVHNYIMQMQALFKFEKFTICRQIFSPIFNAKASGISVTINDNRFNLRQKECIQVGLDVVVNPSNVYSNFLLVKGTDMSRVLAEIVKQVVCSNGFQKPKVLVTSNDHKALKSLHQFLKHSTHRINTHFVTNNVSDLKDMALKYINNKQSQPDLDAEKISLYQQCVHYLQSDLHFDVSVEMIILLNSIYETVKHNAMKECPVIMGRVDDLCNDTAFYKLYSNASKHSINCCVVDGSASLTEPQLYSLLFFGCNKFIFGYNSHDRNIDTSDVCVKYGLSRSFCTRYLDLYRSDPSNASQFATFYDFGNSVAD